MKKRSKNKGMKKERVIDKQRRKGEEEEREGGGRNKEWEKRKYG